MHELDVRLDFDFGEDVWLNAAHQGPLPRCAIEAAHEATARKARPWLIQDDEFLSVPARLRAVIGELIGAEPTDIVLGNSTTYGIDLVARGLDWNRGDEVLYVEGEFPASVFPWLTLADRGVAARSFRAAEGNIPSPEELLAQLRPQTRVFICSWVNSFSGYALEVDAVSRACRDAGIVFVLNASQGLGARPLSVRGGAIDVVTSCGYKWLLGPYATGFCWIAPDFRRRLTPPHSYWLPNVWGQKTGMESYSLRDDLGARAFDVFAPANFQTSVPWMAALEYIGKIGMAHIERHNAGLVATLINSLDTDRYVPLSPRAGSLQSAIVVVKSRNPQVAVEHLERALAKEHIYGGVRTGALRLCPHFYNSRDQMLHTATVLNALS